MEAQDWRIEFDLGGRTAREYSDIMLQQARMATEDWWAFANQDTTANQMQTGIQDIVAAAVQSVAAVTEPTAAIASGKDAPTVGAMARGNQETLSAILNTRQPIEQKSLEELKAQTNYLRSIESRGVVLKAAEIGA
jgi:esterase/lipase